VWVKLRDFIEAVFAGVLQPREELISNDEGVGPRCATVGIDAASCLAAIWPCRIKEQLK
jgi:hypothetical protein